MHQEKGITPKYAKIKVPNTMPVAKLTRKKSPGKTYQR